MKLASRVKRLEGSAGGCRACYGRVIAIRYDPPPEGPAMFAGLPVPPVECPACGKAPGILLTVAPPKDQAVVGERARGASDG